MDRGTTRTRVRTAPPIIERPRLTRILDESTARTILLVAPAGYGKTTLARQWQRDKPHVWYRATQTSADPVVLARGLAMALEWDTGRLDNAIAANPALAGRPEQLAELIAPTPAERDDSWLVIDDYHFVAASAASEKVAAAVVSARGGRILITSRAQPRWCTARELMYGDITIVGMDQLRMTATETAAATGRQDARATELATRTHGWPALVRLAAAGEDVTPPARQTPAVAFQFFAEELLRDVPADVEEWLSDCAVAPSLLELDPVPFGVSEEAIRRGFITEDEHRREMHPLVREFLATRLARAPGGLARARAVIERVADLAPPEETFDAILEFGDAELLDRFLRRQASMLLKSALTETARLWRERAFARGYSGPVLELIEADQLERKGRLAQAHELAVGVADRLRDDDPLLVTALVLAGRTAYMADELAASASFFTRAGDRAETPADKVAALWGALSSLVELEHPDVPSILEKLRRIDCGDDLAAKLRVSLGEMYFECYLGNASRGLVAASTAENLLIDVADDRVGSSFASMYSLLLVFTGSYTPGVRYAAMARARAEHARLEFALPHIDVRDALARIGLGNYGAAARLLSRTTAHARAARDGYLETIAATARARLLISQGLAEQVRALEPPVTLSAAGFCGEWLAVHAVAAALAGDGNRANSLATEATAATESRPTQVTAAAAAAAGAAVVGEGCPERLTALLHLLKDCEHYDTAVCAFRGCTPLVQALETLDCRSELEPVRQRLLLLSRRPRPVTPTGDDRLAALSPPEREVIQLVAQGLTNKAIANALFISDVTVKVHLRHVYEKLGVRSRTEAALLVRDAELVPIRPQGHRQGDR